MNILKIKRDLNAVAELGWNEVRTTALIRETLLPRTPIIDVFGKKNVGLAYRIGTGSNSILIRADIDALRTEKGVIHICGHSTHTAGLMGTFMDTMAREKDLNRQNKSIVFLFQPAEETYPSGAHAFVTENGGLLGTLRYAFAVHVRPRLPLGVIGLQPGYIWAQGDYMEITIRGKSAHIKNNTLGKDANLAGAYVIQEVNRLQNQYPDIRIGIGVMSGGLQANTVSGQALLRGDIRLPNKEYAPVVKKELNRALKKVAARTGTQIELKYFDGTPPVFNDPAITKQIHAYLDAVKVPKLKIRDTGLFSYGCEDFAYISEKIPSVTALIGTGDAHDLHEDDCVISDGGTRAVFRYYTAVVDWFIGS